MAPKRKVKATTPCKNCEPAQHLKTEHRTTSRGRDTGACVYAGCLCTKFVPAIPPPMLRRKPVEPF